MDGTKPVILLDDIQRPEAITIDLKEKMLYFSAQYPSYVKVMDVNGNNLRTLLSETNNIAQPKALGVYDNRLFYLDPKYERIGRVDLPSGDNPKVLLENEPDLKTFAIYQKQQPCKYFLFAFSLIEGFLRDFLYTQCNNCAFCSCKSSLHEQ